MKLFIELLARSTGLKRELRESEQGFQRFGSIAKREMASIRQASGALGSQLAALGLTIGAVQQLSLSANLDKSLTQVKQTAGETGDVVKGLRKDFFDMSRETGRNVEGMKSGFDSLIQSGQNWKAALESTRGINIANAVTSADEKVLAGGLVVGAKTFGIDLEQPGRALELLDKMTVAGRLGNAELGDLSSIFSRIGTNAKASNLGFEQTLGFIEALSQVEVNPERLATLADSTLRVFTNGRYMADAEKATGIQFFDKKGGARDPITVLEDIKKRWDTIKTDKQRLSFIQGAFGKADLDTIKGIRTLLNDRSLVDVRNFTKQIGGAAGTLQRDLPEAVSNAVDQAGRLKAVLRQAADDFAQPINRVFSNFTKFSLDTKANGGLGLTGKQIIGGGAALLGGTYLAARLGNTALKGVASRLLARGGSTALGVAEGKILQIAAGVTPVFVVNWPVPGLPVPGLPVPGLPVPGLPVPGLPVPGALSRAKDLWRLAGSTTAKGASYLPILLPRLGFVGMAAGGGYLAGMGINKGIGAGIGMMSGGRNGDGAIGEMLYDVINRQGAHDTGKSTAVQPEYSKIPSHNDAAISSMFSNLFNERNDKRGAVKNEIKIDLQIDSNGRMFARSNDMSTSADVGTRRGSFFDALMTTEAM